VLMFIGRRQSRNEPSRTHPFGFGRARYMSAFVVSIVLFVGGGLFGLYEGYQKIANPHPLETWYWAIGVLLVAVVLESLSLRTAVRASKPIRGRRSWFSFVRRVRIPELPVILLEDTAALIGLAFALAGVVASTVTGDPVYDGVGSMAIGVLLVTVAVTLAVETGSMVLGESATQEDVGKIREALVADGAIVDVHDLRTLHLGPDDLLVVARIGVSEADATRLTDVVEEAEQRIREALPTVRTIYVQPTAAGDGSRRG
ncbi:MAG: cation diffusion facilitator family transporter, partial [Acidothermales bacterium]|nr:cation diffusion facilitator family transporter [Acidothermales bacterium]